jgi:hypothetical protein
MTEPHFSGLVIAAASIADFSDDGCRALVGETPRLDPTTAAARAARDAERMAVARA